MEIIKQIHQFTALLSITGFALRGFWMIQDSPNLQLRIVKVVPHINDTLLLISAITLAILTSQYPGSSNWLTAKVIALIIYILLGFVALRLGKTKSIRVTAWLLAIGCFGYIVGVAVSKNPVIFY
jgi:uncharacterized membrane protein SirB2